MLINFMRGLTYSVNIIVTSDLDGNPHGTTISSLISVNVEPGNEELLIVLKKNSHTVSVLKENAIFTISLLSSNQTETAKHFSMNRQSNHSREYLTQTKYQEIDVFFTKNPAATLVCEFIESYSRDESLIIIAQVLETNINNLEKILTYSQREYN